jgi:hypothetical protein
LLDLPAVRLLARSLDPGATACFFEGYFSIFKRGMKAVCDKLLQRKRSQ